jgi:hypothetical protein
MFWLTNGSAARPAHPVRLWLKRGLRFSRLPCPLPANPVDFEQREGRVNRFGGHVVRRNIAARHRASVMTSKESDPWKAAYDAARDQSAQLGEFAPYWIYPGSFRVERQLINYPLSRDTAKLVALKGDLALYRLAFGQPRQEDLLDFLNAGESMVGTQWASTCGLTPSGRN